MTQMFVASNYGENPNAGTRDAAYLKLAKKAVYQNSNVDNYEKIKEGFIVRTAKYETIISALKNRKQKIFTHLRMNRHIHAICMAKFTAFANVRRKKWKAN
ncbi:hypothetical protein FACS189446_2580 [Bacteroidia bacterium]|nr:hypothetical protein FACS189446_2580 [Bacteroidia bacterium]